MLNRVFLIRNLPEDKKINAKNDFLKFILDDIKSELEFYKKIFTLHQNSAIFNLRIKTINGKKIWIDKVLDRPNIQLLNSLDKDDEVNEWLKPIRCER
tara:strand:+ start:356 stop:649 length:294 start_codon:yes stop_codon:yes gene_type:complete